MKTKLLLCAVGFAVSLFITERAAAQTLTTTFVEINPNVPVNGSYDGINFYDLPSGVAVFTDFQAFCVEPLQHLTYGQTVVYDIQDPATLANVNLIASLVGGFLSSSMSGQDAAAVQWAIWEIVQESSATKSLSSGNIIIGPNTGISPASQAVAALADQYLANINNFTPVQVAYLTNENDQDVIAFLAVPEPATAGLAALSLLVILRRRRL